MRASFDMILKDITISKRDKIKLLGSLIFYKKRYSSNIDMKTLWEDFLFLEKKHPYITFWKDFENVDITELIEYINLNGTWEAEAYINKNLTPLPAEELIYRLSQSEPGAKIYCPFGLGDFVRENYNYTGYEEDGLKNLLMFIKNDHIIREEPFIYTRMGEKYDYIFSQIPVGPSVRFYDRESVKDYLDYLLKKDLINERDSQVFSHRMDALYLLHIYLSLKDNGKAYVLLPNSSLATSGRRINSFLMSHFCLDSVIDLGKIMPNTIVKYSLLIIHKGKKRHGIQFIDGESYIEEAKTNIKDILPKKAIDAIIKAYETGDADKSKYAIVYEERFPIGKILAVKEHVEKKSKEKTDLKELKEELQRLKKEVMRKEDRIKTLLDKVSK